MVFVTADPNNPPIHRPESRGPSVTELAFSLVSKPGLHAVLIGSGVSRSAGIATGWGITLDLCQQLAAAEEIQDLLQPDWTSSDSVEDWYEERYGEPLGFSSLLQHVAPHRTERQAVLKRYIEPAPQSDDRQPTPAHRSLAHLASRGLVRVFITTNFDRLLEQALTEVGIHPVVLASPAAIAGAEPFHHAGVVVLKLHGDYQDPESMLVTDAELINYESPVIESLSRALEDYALLVCGWSGEWDPALRKAILSARARYPFYFAHRGNVPQLTQDLLDLRRASKITIVDSDTLFTDLVRKVDALERSRTPGPLDRTALIQQTKNLLSHRVKAIELDDLVTGETTRLIQVLEDETVFPPNPATTTDSEIVLEGVRQVESLLRHTSALASMFATAAAYETTETTDGAWMRSFERILRTEGRNRYGTNKPFLTRLSRLPALLILYATATAAVDRSNFRLLHSLVTDRSAKGHESVDRLLHPWRPFDSDHLPRLLADGEQVTPEAVALMLSGRQGSAGVFRPVSSVSRLLNRICREQLSHLIPDAAGFDLAFDGAELLLSMITTDVVLLNDNTIGIEEVHLGMFASRDRYNQERIVLEEYAAAIAAEGEGWGPLKAGMFGGETRRAERSLDELKRVVSRNPR